MKISPSFIPMVAGLMAFGLGSCGPNASTTVQNARIEEQLKNLQNALAQPAGGGGSDKDLQQIKNTVEEISKTTSTLNVAVADLKSGQDPKASNEALVKEMKALIEPMQKQIAELSEKVAHIQSAGPAAGPRVARDDPPANPNPAPRANPSPPVGPKADSTIEIKWPEERGGGGRTQPSNRGGGGRAPKPPGDGPINMPDSPGVIPTPGNAGAGPSEKASEIIDVRWPEEKR